MGSIPILTKNDVSVALEHPQFIPIVTSKQTDLEALECSDVLEDTLNLSSPNYKINYQETSFKALVPYIYKKCPDPYLETSQLFCLLTVCLSLLCCLTRARMFHCSGVSTLNMNILLHLSTFKFTHLDFSETFMACCLYKCSPVLHHALNL